MLPFFGREKELADLEQQYSSDRFEFAVIYGRRRVGKTFLIQHFLEGKEAISFTAIESNTRQNLENLSSEIMAYMTGERTAASFPSYQVALEKIFALAEKKRIVFVMDEYPWAAEECESLSSTLQMLIDRNQSTSKLFLILCGSSYSIMFNEVLSCKAPLFEQYTFQYEIEPLRFADICGSFPGYTLEENALLYGVLGGSPYGLSSIDPELTVGENIRNLFLHQRGLLFDEVPARIREEVRTPARYNSVLSAIAGGSSTMAEIADRTGENQPICKYVIENLMALKLVRRERPYGDKRKYRTIFVMADNMFRFWYMFVFPNLPLISRSSSEETYRFIEPMLPQYMGPVFEDICCHYLWSLRASGKCPVEFADLGRWWGSDPRTRKRQEIDIMGDDQKGTALFAECRWTDKPVDVSVLHKLRYRSGMFEFQRMYYYLFSRSGFTEGCIEEAQQSRDVILVRFDEMFPPE